MNYVVNESVVFGVAFVGFMFGFGILLCCSLTILRKDHKAHMWRTLFTCFPLDKTPTSTNVSPEENLL